MSLQVSLHIIVSCGDGDGDGDGTLASCVFLGAFLEWLTVFLFIPQEKAENFVMAALFCASEEGNVDGLKELSEMAANIDLNTANKVSAVGGHMVTV